MINMKEYNRWIEFVDDELRNELLNYSEKDIEDSFYKNLSFGTGGLRGVIGAGTNRMNIYTVAKATQGLSDYLIKNFKKPSVVIGFDSRINSDIFAKVAACVFAANGVQVNIWSELTPVSTVSFAIRHLKSSAGIMITASHNPSRYNGYKVYDENGCQITTKVATDILEEIEKLDIFSDIKKESFDKALESKKIKFISTKIMSEYINEVKNQSVLYGEELDRDFPIVYSPLNGTGYKPVTRILSETGYTNILLVEEQKNPDGNFPTCAYPNPEIEEAMALGIKYAKELHADLFIATDPDCDRVGVAIKNKNNEYCLLSGNEIGILLLNYICSQRVKHGKMPINPVVIKTIVTTSLGEKIANDYGIKTIDVLTGFKYIGEQISFLEKQGKVDSFIFGFEESYGYLSGSYVRDKDGVNGVYMICEMFSYYKKKNIDLLDKLNEIYNKYGYCLNTLHSYEFDGAAGFVKMKNIIKRFKNGLDVIDNKKVIEIVDYSIGINGLPKADVLKYILEKNCSIVIRPSGTEPKIKVYVSITSETKEQATEVEIKIKDYIERILDEVK